MGIEPTRCEAADLKPAPLTTPASHHLLYEHYSLNRFLKSATDARNVFLFHKIHFERAPGVSGFCQCSPIPECRFKYRALRVTSLCFVKSEYPFCPNGTIRSFPFFSNTASHFFSFLCDGRTAFNFSVLRGILFF